MAGPSNSNNSPREISGSDEPEASPFSATTQIESDEEMTQGWSNRLLSQQSLYRYVSIAGNRFAWFEQTVLESQLHFSRFEGFNDPFEGTVKLRWLGSEAEIRAYWEAHLAEVGQPMDEGAHQRIRWFIDRAEDEATHEKLQSVHDAEIASLGTLCLSESPDNLPMWGYYADSHRGVCLRFRSKSLLGWESSFPPIPVEYSENYPSASFYRDSRLRRLKATLTTKSDGWKHEREWRIIRSSSGLMTFPASALVGVILGCRVDAACESRVRKVLERREPKVELLRAHVAEREFRLEIRPA